MMRDLSLPSDLDAVLGERDAVLLKHGEHCPISRAARGELDAFAERHPEIHVYRVEVTGQRALSDEVADRLGVAHASPQAFVLRAGRVAWRAQHFDITARALEAQLDG